MFASIKVYFQFLVISDFKALVVRAVVSAMFQGLVLNMILNMWVVWFDVS